MKELQQLIDQKVMHPRDATTLSQNEKRSALKYLMFLKEKRCGKVKGWGCADGRKQRLYKSKEETSSPTVWVESLFLSNMINAKENRKVITCDIPGAFMQANIDEHMSCTKANNPCSTQNSTRPCMALFRPHSSSGKKLSAFLIDKQGFEWNKYDWCVINKIMEGKQCTIAWYVNDIKMSHAKQELLEDLLTSLNKEFGKEAPLTVTRGEVHDYLGMTFDYTIPGKVKITMPDFVQGVLDECPEDLMKGPSSTPAANHLFNIDPECNKLSNEKASRFHHLTAKVLYLMARSPDSSVDPDDTSSQTRQR